MAKTLNVLHVAQNTNGYERVKLLANRISKTNSFSLIEKDGVKYQTGGFIFHDTKGMRELFDTKPKSEHYAFATILKVDPFVKAYWEE